MPKEIEKTVKQIWTDGYQTGFNRALQIMGFIALIFWIIK